MCAWELCSQRLILTPPKSCLTTACVNDPMVNDIVIASGEVRPGALFACVPGSRADGHDYAQ